MKYFKIKEDAEDWRKNNRPHHKVIKADKYSQIKKFAVASDFEILKSQTNGKN